MNPFFANFQELYRRHLCRHSEFGINVLHLIAVVGIYISLFAIAFALPGTTWILCGVLGTYFLILALNIPPLLLVVSALVVFLLMGGYLALPKITVWVYVGMIFVWHRFQNWNHKVYDKHLDMSEFEAKYKKGLPLFFLLAIYELPILLNYLLFDRRNSAS